MKTGTEIVATLPPRPNPAARLAHLAREIGLGFHIDTSPCEYVYNDGAHVFTIEEARIVAGVIEEAHDRPEDPYEVVFAAWRAAGLLED